MVCNAEDTYPDAAEALDFVFTQLTQLSWEAQQKHHIWPEPVEVP
jgi:hypothetical protein